MNYIDEKMEQDREMSSAELSRKFFEEFGINVSAVTVRKIRYKLKWRQSGTQYCQLIREPNKLKRLNYCLEAMTRNETFGNVLFTDECTVELQRNVGKSFRRLGQPRLLVPKPKHPIKVCIYVSYFFCFLFFSAVVSSVN